MTAFFHHRSAVAARLTSTAPASAGTTCSPNDVDERPAAPGRRGGSTRRRSRRRRARPGGRGARPDRPTRARARRRPRAARTGGLVEVLDQLEVPAQRRVEDVACATGRGRWRSPRRRSAPTTRAPGGTPACRHRRARGRRRARAAGRRAAGPRSTSAVGPRADPRRGRRGDGGAEQRRRRRPARVHSRARSTVTSPWWVTSSPANSARITSTHSPSRRVRVALSGQPPPVMCSLDASPVPSATHSRPGNISASVAAAWAMMAG